MLKKKQGFDGQKAIIIPRKILKSYCGTNPLISACYVTDIGYYPKAKYHFRERPQGSSQNILIYCSEGFGSARIANREYILKPGNFLMIPTGISHKYFADEKAPWTIYWTHFAGVNAANLISALLGLNDSYLGYVDYHDSRIRLFEDMYYNLEMGYSYNNLCYANIGLQHYLASFVFNENFYLFDKKQSRNSVNFSISEMQRRIDEMLSLKDMANTVNLSPSHFSMIFKKSTGFSPIEYFNHLKVQKACQYLLFTDLRIKEIAEKLGIEDPYYFSRMFTKIIGMSPALYRIKRIS